MRDDGTARPAIRMRNSASPTIRSCRSRHHRTITTLRTPSRRPSCCLPVASTTNGRMTVEKSDVPMPGRPGSKGEGPNLPPPCIPCKVSAYSLDSGYYSDAVRCLYQWFDNPSCSSEIAQPSIRDYVPCGSQDSPSRAGESLEQTDDPTRAQRASSSASIAGCPRRSRTATEPGPHESTARLRASRRGVRTLMAGRIGEGS